MIALSLIAIKLPDTDFKKQTPTEWNNSEDKLTSTHCGPIFEVLFFLIFRISNNSQSVVPENMHSSPAEGKK